MMMALLRTLLFPPAREAAPLMSSRFGALALSTCAAKPLRLEQECMEAPGRARAPRYSDLRNLVQQEWIKTGSRGSLRSELEAVKAKGHSGDLGACR